MSTIITGIVINVVPKANVEHVTFNVKWIEKSINVSLTCMFYCPVRKNDSIYAECKNENPKVYTVIRPPMVLIDKSKENILLNFMIVYKIKYNEALNFYNIILNEAVEEEKIYDYITSLAEKWHLDHHQEVLNMYGNHNYNTQQLLEYWYNEFNLRELRLLGLTYTEIKEYGKPCQEIFNQCIENPYVIYSLSIEKCDDILARMDIKPNVEEREKGIIVRQLYQNTVKKQWFCSPTRNIGKQYPLIRKHLDSLKLNYQVVVDMQFVYIQKYYKMETTVTDFIVTMLNIDPINNENDPIDKLYIGKNGTEFIRYKALENEKLSKDQEIAVQAALDHKLLMILGGAGVGKTTVIGEIVKNLEFRKLNYLLTGFTGKSVSRLQEVTGKKAATMHKLIYDAIKFKKNEYYDYVIIDEISMVTTELFYQFITTFKNVNQYLLVGDHNQLQPIEAGLLLIELLKASVVPTYYLTKNHRVIEGDSKDGILLNANLIINHDISYPFEFVQTDNFQLIEGGMNDVFEIVKGCYDAGVSIDDVMIISPYKDYLKELNIGCKKIYNPNVNCLIKSVKDSLGTVWTVDDKVMLMKNIKQMLFNGQQGIVTEVNDSFITVDFDGGLHKFKLNAKYKHENDEKEVIHSDELTVLKVQHSYATTLHKSQGQESSIVIIFIPKVNNDYFLNRNLLYTAITRARELVYIITSNVEILNLAACRNPSFRYENLSERLKTKLPTIKPFKMSFVEKLTTIDLLKYNLDMEGYEEDEYDDE